MSDRFEIEEVEAVVLNKSRLSAFKLKHDEAL